MSSVSYPSTFSQSDLKIAVNGVISNLQTFVGNLDDYSSLKSVQDGFKASLTFALQNFASVTQGLNFENEADTIKDIFPETWFSKANIAFVGKSKTTYPLKSQIVEDDLLLWQQVVANVHPMSSTMKWPNMYNNGGKWGTRNTKGTSTTVSYPGKSIRKMLDQLPPINPLKDSLVKAHKHPGYVEHIKTGPFYGPYLFSNCYAVMQGKFVEHGTCNDYGWRVMIKEDSIEYNEMDNDKYIGFRREVYERVAIDSDYTGGSANSRKLKFWYLDEADKLQCFKFDYSEGTSKPPGFNMKPIVKGEDGKIESDSGSDGGMGGMFD